ncbi:MAG: histidine phosphotransferase [Proteobacteria bacterium]|nr:histidine phosphotransferase [Pseudomonadota bacterium]
MTDETRLAELLCTRLCHELVSPVGAIGGGVELLTGPGGEAPAGVDPEALALLDESARRATARLKFYRLAYGGAAGRAVPLAEVRALALGAIGNGRVRLDWPEAEAPADLQLPAESARLALNLLLLAGEALGRGGEVAVRLAPGEGAVDLVLRAEGPQAGLAEESRAAFAGARAGRLDGRRLTVRSVHAAFAGMLVARAGAAVALSEGEAAVDLRATLRL